MDYSTEFRNAVDSSIKRAQDANSKYVAKYSKCLTYAEKYEKLVISFVKAYDFINGNFDIDLVDKEVLAEFGTPISISNDRDPNRPWFNIYLAYDSKNHCRGGIKNNPDFDLEIINSILSRDNISIKSDTVQGIDCISFYASVLLDKRKEILQERADAIKQMVKS